MKFLQHAIEYAVFWSLRRFLGVITLRSSQRLGAAAGRFIGGRLGFRRVIAELNLRNAFPDRPTSWYRAKAEESFASVGITLFELLRFDRLTVDELRGMVHIDGAGLLVDAQTRGKGVILLTAHFGSWEIVPQALSAVLGVPGSILVRGLANPLVDRAIDRLRRCFGNQTIPATLAVRSLYRALEHGDIVYMAADQSAPPESVRVPFFDRLTPAFEGPAVLTLRTGACILFTVAKRLADGRYQMRFEQIASEDLVPESPDAVGVLTARCLAATERAIRDEPSQWMWMHRRWKHVAVPS